MRVCVFVIEKRKDMQVLCLFYIILLNFNTIVYDILF